MLLELQFALPPLRFIDFRNLTEINEPVHLCNQSFQSLINGRIAGTQCGQTIGKLCADLFCVVDGGTPAISVHEEIAVQIGTQPTGRTVSKLLDLLTLGSPG